ncbi:MAG: glycosyltransferase [Longimicrobiales bacterium]
MPAAVPASRRAQGVLGPWAGIPTVGRATLPAHMIALLLTAPWIGALLLLPLLLRRQPRIDEYPPRDEDLPPHVTIIVPARNEVPNLGACVASLLNSRYLRRDVIIVDDRSTDGTGDVAHALAQRSAGDLEVLDGEPLPRGWVGKPWACWQGYLRARGELLLFTDADTRHDPALLGHAVATLLREQVDLVTVLPRQILGSFWERVIMPHVLTLIAARFSDARRVNRTKNPGDVVANGQFLLVRRSAYEAVGGHQHVRHEIVEDLRLAQEFVAARRRIFLVHGEDVLSTRMYRSFREIVGGWSKNLALGSRASVPAWLRPVTPWLLAALLLLFWVLPPLVLALAFAVNLSSTFLAWAAAATAVSLVFWATVAGLMDIGFGYALLYPLGAAITATLLARSALLGERVTWKGRTYGGDVAPQLNPRTPPSRGAE